jgi:hypothetical protein
MDKAIDLIDDALHDALNPALLNTPCGFCVEGSVDSGGTLPWGEAVWVRCGACNGTGLLHRFKPGDEVWVRDRGHGMNQIGGYAIVKAKVRQQHFHPDRHPGYPHGEGYTLDGDLWWDCYPGCRVFATRSEAIKARIPK